MKLYDTIFPNWIETFKFDFFFINYIIIELVVLLVFILVPSLFFLDPGLDQFVDLWLQNESDIDQVAPHWVQVATWAFFLELFQVVEAVSQILDLIFSLFSLLAHFFPDAIHVLNFVG